MFRKKSNEDYFEKIDSEVKAYLLGFYLADGSVSLGSRCTNSFRHQVGLSIIDLIIVEKFQSEICPNNKIGHTHYKKGAKNRKPVCNVRWTSTKMKEDLENLYGIKYRKTYDFDFKMNFDNIPKKYWNSFILGYFDGDGCISYTNNHFQLGIYSTSKPFLEQIGKIFEKEFDVKPIIDVANKKNIDLYCLRFYAYQQRRIFILKLHKYFYTNSTINLKRKKDKFESYLNTVLSSKSKKFRASVERRD